MKTLPSKMFTSWRASAVALAMLFSPIGAVAQADTEPIFFIVDYMKVKPGMGDEYLKAEKETWKTIHQSRVKSGKIVDWALYDVRYPSGTGTEYDFVTITTVKSWKAVDDFYTGWEETFKSLPKEQMAVVNKTNSLRDLVRHEVLIGEDFVFHDTKPSKYLLVNFMKVPTGQWDEYVAMETDLVKPMHVEEVKSGKRMGWARYGVIFPYGESQPYNAITVDLYEKWDDIGPGDTEAMLKKIHPKMSMAYFSRQIEAARTLVKGEVWVLSDSTQ